MSQSCGEFGLMPDVKTRALCLPVRLCESAPARELGMMPALAKGKKHANLTQRRLVIVLVLFLFFCAGLGGQLWTRVAAPAQGEGGWHLCRRLAGADGGFAFDL